jgi:hypothetical protein
LAEDVLHPFDKHRIAKASNRAFNGSSSVSSLRIGTFFSLSLTGDLQI